MVGKLCDFLGGGWGHELKLLEKIKTVEGRNTKNLLNRVTWVLTFKNRASYI